MITVVGTKEAGKTTAESVRVAAPAGILAGDLVILMYTGTGAGSSSPPYGFTEHCAPLSTTTGSDLYSLTAYRWSTGDEPDFYYWGHSITGGHVLACIVLRGVHADLWDVTPVHATYHLFEENTEDPTPEAITTNTNNALVVQYSCMLDGTTNADPTTDQSGATIFVQKFNQSSSNALGHYEIKAVAGVYAAAAHNYPGGGGNGETHVLTFAVKAA